MTSLGDGQILGGASATRRKGGKRVKRCVKKKNGRNKPGEKREGRR